LNLTETTDDTINALHAHVARLRRWGRRYGGQFELLKTVNSGYRLNVDRNVVDAHQFTDLVKRALNLAPATPSVVATILEDALSLWRGNALLDALDGPMGSAAADELHYWRAAAREALVDAWLDLGDNQKVVPNARTFIAEDPLNEAMRARYIIALRSMGRYAEAVEAFQSAERVLSEELGVRPGVELCTAAEADLDATIRSAIPAAPVPRHRGRLAFQL
jgi:tetratricopeptide (TPR) repeat protein